MATQNIYTSWGRTRSAKNLAGANGTAITAEADTTNLLGITRTAASVGYATEAQRYLHVLVEETNDGSNTNATATTIFGYCNAFQRWFEIEADTLGQPVAEAAANTAPTAASIDPPNSSTAPALHVPSAREYRVYHIVGVDRIAFVNANAGRVNIFAACSTF